MFVLSKPLIKGYLSSVRDLVLYLPTAEGPWGLRPSWAEPRPPPCRCPPSEPRPPADTPPDQHPPAEAWSHLREKTDLIISEASQHTFTNTFMSNRDFTTLVLHIRVTLQIRHKLPIFMRILEYPIKKTLDGNAKMRINSKNVHKKSYVHTWVG